MSRRRRVAQSRRDDTLTLHRPAFSRITTVSTTASVPLAGVAASPGGFPEIAQESVRHIQGSFVQRRRIDAPTSSEGHYVIFAHVAEVLPLPVRVVLSLRGRGIEERESQRALLGARCALVEHLLLGLAHIDVCAFQSPGRRARP